MEWSGGFVIEELKKQVEKNASHYYHSALQSGIDNKTRSLLLERVLPLVQGPDVLELGYIDGLWTDALVKKGFQVDVVEGATNHTAHAKDRYQSNTQVQVFHSLFQEFKPVRKYDTIVAGDMLRYLPDPEGFLRLSIDWLKPDGKLVATVPNSRSFHRRLGALMNLEDNPMAFNQRDTEVGNLKQYDRYELRSTVQRSGYEVEILKGCFFKPLSSSQMQNWEEKLLRALLEIGDELEDY